MLRILECAKIPFFFCILELGSCQTGWKVFGQFCYQFNLDKKSWYAARLACVSQQAELASIHSPVEQAYITLEVRLYGLDAAWIGKKFFLLLFFFFCLLNCLTVLRMYFARVIKW